MTCIDNSPMDVSVLAKESARDFVWSSSDRAVSKPLQEIMALSAKAITETDISDKSHGHYFALWQRYGLGPVDLNFLEVAAQRVVRSPEMVSRAQGAYYDLMFVQRGAFSLSHCEQRVAVNRPTLIILDNQEPYDLVFPEGTISLTAHLSEAWLQEWVPYPRALVARPLDAMSGWGVPLANMLSTIQQSGLNGVAISRRDMADVFGTLLRLAFGAPPAPLSRRQSDRIRSLRSILHGRFNESEIGPSDIAAEAGISKRRLHALFAASGTTFSKVLTGIRLEHAARILTEERHRRSAIADVAASCGFSDPSHFARCFRVKYGAAPQAFQKKGGPK